MGKSNWIIRVLIVSSSMIDLSLGLGLLPVAAGVSSVAVKVATPSSVTFVNTMSSPRATMNDRLTTITGQYSYVGNPCTTEPCLPGMTYAVLVNETYYYLTIDGRWLSQNQSWDGYMPEVNEIVSIAGVTSEGVDIFGVSFHKMEVESLVPVK